MDELTNRWLNPIMPVTRVPVTGAVLAWAIAESGLSASQAADLIRVDPGELAGWISGEASPSKGDFDRICNVLGRPESFFFLARPPSYAPSTASFRNPPGQKDYRPTPDDLQQIRLAENVQQIAKWLAVQAEFEFKPVRATMQNAIEPVAGRIRQWLNWSTATQMRLRDFEVARLMRTHLEANGIIALNLSLGDNGLRGFCLPDDNAPVIVVNTKDDTRARLFSYLHECAHLSLGAQYLCRERPDNRVERWCEQIAGAVLMPLPELYAYLAEEDISVVHDYEQVRKAANRFRISLRAMAVRLEQTKLGVEGLFDRIDLAASDAPRQGFGRGPSQTRARRRVQSFGAGYVSRLLDAARSGELRDTDVQDLLQLSRKDYRELGQILAEVPEG